MPQGSVLGPLLFLTYIQDLGSDVNNSLIRILKFVDDSKVMASVLTDDDIIELQSNLEKIYNWAGMNNMRWNDKKFQLLRSGHNRNLIEETSVFSPDFENIIESKPVIKDLGILVDSTLRYRDQITKVIKKANQKSSWILRTFHTRKPTFLRKIWKSLVQCHIDYGSVLWAPVSNPKDLRDLEGPLRTFTRKGYGMYEKSYWERLKIFKLTSIQRRNERYKLLYIWKSLNGYVPDLNLKWKNEPSNRSGPVLEAKLVKGSNDTIKNLCRDSLLNFGVMMYNQLPVSIRTFKGKLSEFKSLLDRCLCLSPVQPATESLTPSCKSLMGKPSNSLIDWM